MLSKKDRIHYIIEAKCCGNASEMARRLNLSQQTISAWMRRDTLDYDKVAEAFPDVSAEWLLRGEGAFHRDALVGGTPAEGERAERSAQQYEEIIASLQQEIEILRARCAMLLGSR
jgi:hypothetical protein